MAAAVAVAHRRLIIVDVTVPFRHSAGMPDARIPDPSSVPARGIVKTAA